MKRLGMALFKNIMFWGNIEPKNPLNICIEFCVSKYLWAVVVTSVTRSGDLLDFGQLFKAFVNN